MKQWTITLFTLLMIFSIAACGNSGSGSSSRSQSTAAAEATTQTDTENAADASTESVEATTENSDGNSTQAAEETTIDSYSADGSNILVAYFSVMETDGADTVAGASRVADGDDLLGNTEFVARYIQQLTNGDFFRIQTVQDYPETHDELLTFAYNELENNARPELSSRIENPDNYDTIFLGYPDWNADLPMPLYTFLEEYDFSGKTIIPFVTHGGSSFVGTIDTIKELQPDATVIEDGLSVSRNEITDSEDAITSWVNRFR